MATQKEKINTINKSNYFILDGFIYETDLKKVFSKEKICQFLDLKELDNKLFSFATLKQLQIYQQDGFKIENIEIIKDEIIIKLSNSQSTAKLKTKFFEIDEHLIDLAKHKKDLPKTFKSYKSINHIVTEKRISSKTLEFVTNKLNYDFYKCNKKKDCYILINNKLYIIGTSLNIQTTINQLNYLSFEMLNKYLNKTYNIIITEPIKFNINDFIIHYLILNLEQEKQEIKSNLNTSFKAIKYSDLQPKKIYPITLCTKEKTSDKNNIKTTLNQLSRITLQLEYKPTLLLSIPKNATQSNPKTTNHFDNFTELYVAKVKEKKAIRKQNSKFAGNFLQIASCAVFFLFLFVNTFMNISSSKHTFTTLASIKTQSTEQIAMAPIKSISKSSDLCSNDTKPHQINKTRKNTPLSGLSLISFVVFGVIKRKGGQMRNESFNKEIGFYSKYNLPKINSNLKEHVIDMSYKFIKMSEKFLGNIEIVKYYQHVSDCIQRETITYIEALEILDYLEYAKHFPVWVEFRKSNYSHLF